MRKNFTAAPVPFRKSGETFVTPQDVIITAKCNINAKCNKIFNAECNNLSTRIVISFLTHNVITQNVIISEQRRACYQISNPNQITHTPFPSSGQKWSALKRRN